MKLEVKKSVAELDITFRAKGHNKNFEVELTRDEVKGSWYISNEPFIESNELDNYIQMLQEVKKYVKENNW